MKFVAAWIQNEKCPANGDGIGNGTDALEFLRSGAEWIYGIDLERIVGGNKPGKG